MLFRNNLKTHWRVFKNIQLNNFWISAGLLLQRFSHNLNEISQNKLLHCGATYSVICSSQNRTKVGSNIAVRLKLAKDRNSVLMCYMVSTVNGHEDTLGSSAACCLMEHNGPQLV